MGNRYSPSSSICFSCISFLDFPPCFSHTIPFFLFYPALSATASFLLYLSARLPLPVSPSSSLVYSFLFLYFHCLSPLWFSHYLFLTLPIWVHSLLPASLLYLFLLQQFLSRLWRPGNNSAAPLQSFCKRPHTETVPAFGLTPPHSIYDHPSIRWSPSPLLRFPPSTLKIPGRTPKRRGFPFSLWMILGNHLPPSAPRLSPTWVLLWEVLPQPSKSWLPFPNNLGRAAISVFHSFRWRTSSPHLLHEKLIPLFYKAPHVK